MAYDEHLAERIRESIGSCRGISEKKMFGGLAFLLGGNMFAGIANDDLMVRVGKERHAEALKKPGARPMDFTGKPMLGYVFVSVASLRRASTLAAWIELALENAATLPAKKPGKRKATSAKKSPAR